MDEIEYHPDFVRGATNLYDTVLLSEAGKAADNVFISGSSYPFLDPELAAQNPATQQYLDIMDEYDPGGKVADLGIAAFSAWLLFARSASACGDDLTRDCVWAEVTAVRDWSGGGLHATQDISGGRAAGCFVEIEASRGEFVLPDIGAERRRLPLRPGERDRPRPGARPGGEVRDPVPDPAVSCAP